MDWREILALPSFLLSFCAFLVSGWTAVQVGRIDFERRRQDLLTRVGSLQVLLEERSDAIRRLVDRLHALDLLSVDEHLKERWVQLTHQLQSTHHALNTILPDRSQFLKAIETMPNGLFQRVKLERAIGAEDRILAGARMVGWEAEFAEYRESVASLEAAFDLHR